MESNKRAWAVGGSIPPKSPKNDKSWAHTAVIHVIAQSAKRAIELVETNYPGITVHTVQHHGRVDVIEDQ